MDDEKKIARCATTGAIRDYDRDKNHTIHSLESATAVSSACKASESPPRERRSAFNRANIATFTYRRAIKKPGGRGTIILNMRRISAVTELLY